jgi:hypothetical protein
MEMVESSSCRYRTYAWEAQRHVYRDAVLGVPQEKELVPPYPARPVPAIPHELVPVAVEAASVVPSIQAVDVAPAIFVPVVMEAAPAVASRELTSLRTPETEVGI